MHRVPVSRGLNCTYEMTISYTHDLANEPIDADIAANMKQIQNEQWEGNIYVSRKKMNFVRKI